MSCGAWGLTLAAVIVVFALTSMFVLASVGIAPVIDANGLSWDSSGYIQRSNNATTRFVVEQEQHTERDRIFWDAAKWVAIVAGVVAVLVVVAVQMGRTRRHADTLRAYIATQYPHAQIEQRNGARVLVDYERQEIVPLQIVEAEWRQLDGNQW